MIRMIQPGEETGNDAANGRSKSLGPATRAWLITDAKTGSDRLAEGIAAALGLNALVKHAKPRPPFNWLAPHGPIDPREGFGTSASGFAPPWPDIAIGVGRKSAPYLRAVRQSASGRCFTVFLLDPRAGRGIADLIWVPEHDQIRGPNVFTTPTGPHPFTPDRLRLLRETLPVDIEALPRPRIAVLLGGRGRHYKFASDGEHERFTRSLASLANSGAGFMLTTSRRTHDELRDAALRGVSDAPHLMYEGGEPNRYGEFLAHADGFVVTGDSANMVGEAAATGRPIFVFMPIGGRGKFDRFHATLRNRGITRPLPERIEAWTPWSYEPLDSTGEIAREIAIRYAEFARATD